MRVDIIAMAHLTFNDGTVVAGSVRNKLTNSNLQGKIPDSSGAGPPRRQASSGGESQQDHMRVWLTKQRFITVRRKGEGCEACAGRVYSSSMYL